jgi:hypothetical protein
VHDLASKQTSYRELLQGRPMMSTFHFLIYIVLTVAPWAAHGFTAYSEVRLAGIQGCHQYSFWIGHGDMT